MKTIKESILSSTKTGVNGYKEYIKQVADKVHYPDVLWIDLSEITFEDFVQCVDDNSFVKILKHPFKDASKDTTMGRLTIQFSNGRLGIEIMSMGTLFNSGEKWWREVFLNETQVKGAPRSKESWVTTYNYYKEFTEVSDKLDKNGKNSFTTPKGAHLSQYIDKFIDYLKQNHNLLKA